MTPNIPAASRTRRNLQVCRKGRRIINNPKQALIVGAGPVGLAAAVFLFKQNQKPRIIESLTEASPYSKALAINPRTLELLESVGVTEKLLAAGRRINEMNMHVQGKAPIRIPLSRLQHKYNFILALSQTSTEKILYEELLKLGGDVERGVRLNHCREGETEIENIASGVKETINPEWILGADGAHSRVREELGLEFAGSSMKNKWYLADVTLQTELPGDRAYAFFIEEGFIFLIPVIERGHADNPQLWRVIGNMPEPLQYLQMAKPAAAPVWESSFHIGHRTARKFAKGNIYLAGDAAHIHSPLGARGMNLGIEDAWAFAKLLRFGKLSQYAPIREKIDGAVVRNVRIFTNIVDGRSLVHGFLRRNILPLAMGLPFMSSRILKVAAGLDHEAMPKISC